MRLDYALYGLAILLFAVTALAVILVSEHDGKLIYAVSTAGLGLLSVGGGYFLRPKATAAATIQTPVPTPQAAPEAPVQQTAAPVVEKPPIAAQIVEAPKIETSIVEASSIQTALAVEPPKVESPAVKAAVAAETQPSTQTVETPVAVPVIKAEISAQAVEAPQTATATAKLEFMQIRGISEKRAEQLKANGINTIEELANASAVDLAPKLNVSPKIVKMWIGSAKKLSK